MGIIGCPENPVTTNFGQPITETNDVKIGHTSQFPQQVKLVTTDSFAWKRFSIQFGGMTLGNGQDFSKYRLVRNSYAPEAAFADISWQVQFGSTSTFFAGNWSAAFPLPFNPYDYTTAISTSLPVIGQWLAYDLSASAHYEGPVFLGAAPSGNPARFASGDDAGSIVNQITNTVPFTWASGDQLIATARVRVVMI